jgi:hypothetical protein
LRGCYAGFERIKAPIAAVVRLEAFEAREFRPVHQQRLRGHTITEQSDVKDVGRHFMAAPMGDEVMIDGHREGFLAGGIDNEIEAGKDIKRPAGIGGHRPNVCFRKLSKNLPLQCVGLPLADACCAEVMASDIAWLERLVVEKEECAVIVAGAALDKEFCQVAADRAASDKCDAPAGQGSVTVHVSPENEG